MQGGVCAVQCPLELIIQSLTVDVSIVAIHGLDTTSERTWSAYSIDGDPQSRLVHWLKDEDMLPSHVRFARIFTYDWNASTFAHASDQYFYHHATFFLNILDACRQGVSICSHNSNLSRSLIDVVLFRNSRKILWCSLRHAMVVSSSQRCVNGYGTSSHKRVHSKS